VRAAGLLMIFVIFILYLTKFYYSRLLLIYFGSLLFLGFLSIRVGAYHFLRSQHRKGNTRKIVLVGSKRFTQEFAFKIYRHPELLYEVVGRLYPVGAGGPDVDRGIAADDKLLSSFDVLGALAERQVDELVVLVDESPGLEFQSFVARCRDQGIKVKLLPRGYELYTSKPTLIEIDGLPLVSLENPSIAPAAAVLKRAIDLILGALLLLPATCIFIAATVVLLRNKRRVLRRELRIGQNGSPFWMYRMDIDREGEGGPAYERIIRDLSISEIPQLWNVLLGQMSLVGPRPESRGRVKYYSEWQRERLKAKPGITGLAQVNGLREHDASEDKTRFDLQYLLEWSPFNDLILILQTVATLVKRCLTQRAGAKATAVAGSHRREQASRLKSGSIVREVTHADRA
jgi:lipopolysaccharide/colanic/teichoic acid biosynthesis glycosyltransferase